MLSQPNIARFVMRRTRFDQNDVARFLFSENGTPVNVTARSYLIWFCKKDTSEIKLILTNTDFTRPTTDSIEFNPSDYVLSLADAETYTMLLFEVLAGGKRDHFALGDFQWLTLPGFVEGQPKQPAYIQFDLTPAASVSSASVFVATAVVGIRYPATLAQAQTMTDGLVFVAQTDSYYIRVSSPASGLIPLFTDSFIPA